jgi:23S rRNA pseudouridine2605 synthase
VKTANNGDAVRLNRYLASCGLGSRRHCDGLISSGRIYVNKVKTNRLGSKVVVGRDEVAYKGTVLSPVLHNRYLAYHIPLEYEMASSNQQAHAAMYDSIKKAGIDIRGLKDMGGSGEDAEGLILLTDDGDLVHRCSHARYPMKTVYDILLDKKLSAAGVESMKHEGVESNGQTLFAADLCAHEAQKGHWYRVEVLQEKKHHVRRMLTTPGYRVVRCVRIQFGPIKLAELVPGECRELSGREINALRATGYAPVHPNRLV